MPTLTTNSAGELLHCGELLYWFDCPECAPAWCFGARCVTCDYAMPTDCNEPGGVACGPWGGLCNCLKRGDEWKKLTNRG